MNKLCYLLCASLIGFLLVNCNKTVSPTDHDTLEAILGTWISPIDTLHLDSNSYRHMIPVYGQRGDADIHVESKTIHFSMKET